jgi:hypothetical protein
MAWYEDRVKQKNVLDRFCKDKMTYEFLPDFRYEANLFNGSKKFVGVAKIFYNPSNFGNNPIVEINKDDFDFLYELGLITGKASAIIVKFRDNKIAYLKQKDASYVTTDGRKTNYKIPIGEFKLCG